MRSIDFEVNQRVFKVESHKYACCSVISGNDCSVLPCDPGFGRLPHRPKSWMVDKITPPPIRCWNSKKWNPDWFVAEDADQNAWRFEAAIPQSAFGTPIRAGDLWVVNIQRTLPGVVQQYLTNQAVDADGRDAEGFGLLRFIRRRR